MVEAEPSALPLKLLPSADEQLATLLLLLLLLLQLAQAAAVLAVRCRLSHGGTCGEGTNGRAGRLTAAATSPNDTGHEPTRFDP